MVLARRRIISGLCREFARFSSLVALNPSRMKQPCVDTLFCGSHILLCVIQPQPPWMSPTTLGGAEEGLKARLPGVCHVD